MNATALVSTVLGIGYFPKAQGTIMSAVAMPFAYFLAKWGGPELLAGAAMITLVIGTFSCEAYVRQTGKEDPSECVIDELAGQWLTCAFVASSPLSLPAFASAFILFRIFDIWKPWPVSWADNSLPGGFGVMMDDILAGVMAGILALALHHYQWL